MSNGRAFRRRLVDLLGPLDGLELPGGCSDCTATQSLRALAAGVWEVSIHHDATCPALAAMEAHR